VRDLGIAFVGYSPLGRGFLTGQIKRYEDLAEDDYRRLSPRFQGDNFARNLELVRRVEAIAKRKVARRHNWRSLGSSRRERTLSRADVQDRRIG
jgi:aryl-alcohol dehydrogenase-like predicted oxidoreductase